MLLITFEIQGLRGKPSQNTFITNTHYIQHTCMHFVLRILGHNLPLMSLILGRVSSFEHRGLGHILEGMRVQKGNRHQNTFSTKTRPVCNIAIVCKIAIVYMVQGGCPPQDKGHNPPNTQLGTLGTRDT